MTALLNSDLSLTIAWVLAEMVLKSSLLLVAAAAVAFVLRGATASLRHLVWCCAIIGMLAIPAMSFVLPRWQLSLLSPPQALRVSELAQSPIPVSSPGDRRIGANAATASPQTPSGAAVATELTSSNGTPRDWFSALILLWLGGVAAGLITIGGGFVTLRRIARRSHELSDPAWTGLIAEIALDLDLNRSVRVLMSDTALTPATWGVVRPTVLLPADAENWSDERKRVVLLHELSHVRRKDCLTQVTAQLCCAVYWFHPGAWYVAKRLRAERELACDEHVLDVGVNACDYAAHLLEIATLFRTPHRAAIVSVAMARPSQLEDRLLAILREHSSSRLSATPRMRAATVIALAAVSVPLSAMRPWTTETPAVPQPALTAQTPALNPILPDTFRWRGVVPPGKWVEVLARYSDMRAELSNSNNVEILAIRRNGRPDSYRIAIDTAGGGVRACPVSADYTGSKPCDRMSDEPNEGLSDTHVDFLVKIPAGVGVSLHTVRGNITATGVRSYVWGTSGRGDVNIVTSDLAEASTSAGNISAEFSRRSWRQDLEFLSEDGDVTVIAPRDASMMIQVETSSGQAIAEFPGRSTRFGAGQRIVSRAGAGSGMLTLRTGRGKAELKRGPPAVAERSSIEIGDRVASPRSDVDPKPNPNPEPDFNPNPNPLYDPDENPLPEIDSADANAEGVTGELLPVVIPAGLVSRFREETIRGWPDAPAIRRIRDIAATHRKKHPNDYVRERSEWALTLVRNGEIVTPLRNALSSADWRERAYAAWVLGVARDPRSAEVLTAALGDAHWRVRMHAAASLVQNGSARSVPQLIGALRDEHWQVRVAAVDALASIGDRRALPSLQQIATQDPQTVVRDEARSALARMK
jgi:beta-lactamase regulating signal transducer with metallopeptidase domain